MLSVYGASILGQPYVMNEFLTVFANYFMYEETKQHIFESEFDRLKSPIDGNRYGTFEAFRNTVKPMSYNEGDLARILRLYKPDVKTAYFARNRQDVFPMSITREELEGAFADFTKFDNFITGLYTQLVNSNKVVEYNAIKECINVNVQGGAIKKRIIPTINSGTAPAIAKLIREYVIKMQKPSTEYNAYADMEGAVGDPVETSTPKKSLLLIADADTIANISIDVLASAFNLQYADFQINLIEVDDFGYNLYDRERRTVVDHKNSNIKFIICDEALFNIKDLLDVTMQGTNDATFVKQTFYHVWQMINVRPWANAIAFCYEEDVEFETSGLVAQYGSPVDVMWEPKTASLGNEITGDIVLTDNKGNTIVTKDDVPDDYDGDVESTDPKTIAYKILSLVLDLDVSEFINMSTDDGIVTITRATNKSVYAGTFDIDEENPATTVTITNDELTIFKETYGIKTAWKAIFADAEDENNNAIVIIPTVSKTIWNK